jgi:hypothetical protein
MQCTRSVRFEEQFPSTTSAYAEEGTLAHSVCELMVRKKFTPMSSRKYNAELKKLKDNELWQDEMLKTAEFYVDYLTRKAMAYDQRPHVAPEMRVDLSEWVPEGFGTCDCIMIGGDTLHITDYKHGKGVIVSAVDNPQMRLYALGALAMYRPIYGDTIKQVSMAIVQPRVTEDVSEECITVGELLAWGEKVKPLAQMAFAGLGEFVPGDHCRFCRGKAQCRARAEMNTALEEFKGCVPAGSVQPGEFVPQIDSYITPNGTEVHPLLSDAEIGDLLKRGEYLVQWYADLQAYALGAILEGKEIPGYKVVAGRSNRAFADQDAALETIKAAGYDEALLYERKAKTLSELEKMLGKKTFADLVGSQIVKPVGKPTLVPLSDKREAYSAAVSDFAGVVD